MINIAIFENLNSGGALNQVKKYIKYFNKLGYNVDLYTHTQKNTKYVNKIYNYPVLDPKNSVYEIFKTINQLKINQQKIANEINNKKYSLILIFPCKFTQCPFITKYIKNKNTYYFFLETKREFYENTSHDYYSIKRIIARIIRIPIKLIDINNCKNAEHIISNSYYSKYVLNKIYKKKSTVIYPNLKQIKMVKHKIKNRKNFLSVGLISKLKNNDFTIESLKPLNQKLNLVGNYSNDKHKTNYKIYCKLLPNINDQKKIKIYKKNTFYMANQIKEPFGLTTLEAANYNNFIFGLNIGGTSEIIQNGLNGILYPNNIKFATKIIKTYLSKKSLIIHKTCIINWKTSVKKILEFTHTPNA